MACGLPITLPPSREAVASWIASMTQPSSTAPSGLAPSTMRGYLTGLRDTCKRLGHADPFAGDWFLARVFRAAKRRQGRPTARRLALVQPLLRLGLLALDALLPGPVY